eukprot:c122_g1_i1.p1 GENE.c122_g1_i1~~c122_g1_i1.p1  ORF type:complete len:223 (+),score=45.42 c122_g1_i1:43-711(+)
MLLTMIARAADGLPLVATMDDPSSASIPYYDKYRGEARNIVKNFTKSPAFHRVSITATHGSGHVFHTLVHDGIVYLTLTNQNVSRKLAYAFLEELQREFSTLHGEAAKSANRMYQFIAFDSFMNKTKALFESSQAHSQLQALNKDLADVHDIMVQSYDSLVNRGLQMEELRDKSTQLSLDSKKYVRASKDLNRIAFMRKWAPFFALFLLFVAIFYFRRWYAE